MELNKYLSFDISLHKTLFEINKSAPETCLPYKDILFILNNNWLSTGYQSDDEESLFKSIATDAMKSYALNPLDRGCDIVLLNKFIPTCEYNKISYTKIDKLHFLSSDKLELIDYKSGKTIPSVNKILYTPTVLFTITSIYKKIGVYPDIFSLYYLRYANKITLPIPEELISKINPQISQRSEITWKKKT